MGGSFELSSCFKLPRIAQGGIAMRLLITLRCKFPSANTSFEMKSFSARRLMMERCVTDFESFYLEDRIIAVEANCDLYYLRAKIAKSMRPAV